MTPQEKAAVEMALLPEVAAQHTQTADSDESSNDNDDGTDMWKLLVDGQETDLAEQAKRINGTQYRNLNIVFGSAALAQELAGSETDDSDEE